MNRVRQSIVIVFCNDNYSIAEVHVFDIYGTVIQPANILPTPTNTSIIALHNYLAHADRQQAYNVARIVPTLILPVKIVRNFPEL
jgi:hypothetical protein